MSIEALRKGLSVGRLTISALDDGSGVVLDVEGEQLLEMNASGLAMMQAIADGAEDEGAVAEAVAAKFEVSVERVRGDVGVFVSDVAKVVG
jgi:hypothetical protein